MSQLADILTGGAVAAREELHAQLDALLDVAGADAVGV